MTHRSTPPNTSETSADTGMVYHLTLTADQVRVIRTALDMLYKTSVGQTRAILEVLQLQRNLKVDAQIGIEDLLAKMANILADPKAKHRTSAKDQSRRNDFRVAYDLFQALLWASEHPDDTTFVFPTPPIPETVSDPDPYPHIRIEQPKCPNP